MRNFYDRYFFNGYHPTEGEDFFAVAFGVYPHLNVTDGAFVVVRNGVEIALHVSGQLGDRMDIACGPLRIEIVEPPAPWRRLDLRYTVYFPEDLILCREAFKALKERGPRIPVGDLVRFADGHPALHALVAPYVHPEPIWARAIDMNTAPQPTP